MGEIQAGGRKGEELMWGPVWYDVAWVGEPTAEGAEIE